ncbi:MAG: zinc ribbon domain-containing protein [Halioglobus sp.]
MPIYEYQCQSCGKSLEVLRKISDAPLVDCPACNEPQLRKKVSAAAFRLKGGGWYETDFKTSGKKNLASGSSDAPASSGSSGSSDSSGSSGSSAAASSSSSGSDSKSST